MLSYYSKGNKLKCNLLSKEKCHVIHQKEVLFNSQILKILIFVGTCPNNSKELTDANLNFIKTHPLMNDAVSPFFGSPVLLRTGFNTGFTSIDVDPQVMAPDGSRFDVIFVGTSTGQLIKAVNSLAPKSRITTRTVIIEEIELMSSPVKIGEPT